jgi:hypothetical protein
MGLQFECPLMKIWKTLTEFVYPHKVWTALQNCKCRPQTDPSEASYTLADFQAAPQAASFTRSCRSVHN